MLPQPGAPSGVYVTLLHADLSYIFRAELPTSCYVACLCKTLFLWVLHLCGCLLLPLPAGTCGRLRTVVCLHVCLHVCLCFCRDMSLTQHLMKMLCSCEVRNADVLTFMCAYAPAGT
jgi:hypothetical protein